MRNIVILFHPSSVVDIPFGGHSVNVRIINKNMIQKIGFLKIIIDIASFGLLWGSFE